MNKKILTSVALTAFALASSSAYARLPISGFVFDVPKMHSLSEIQTGKNKGRLSTDLVRIPGTSCDVTLTLNRVANDMSLTGRVESLACKDSQDARLFASKQGSAIGIAAADGQHVNFLRISLWF